MSSSAFELLAQRYEASVELDKVHPHPENPNIGDQDVIAESFSSNGFYGVLVVDGRNGNVLVGNHRWKVAKREGAKRLPMVFVQPRDDAHARRILAVDNRSTELARRDERMLIELLRGLGEDPDALLGTGYDERALARLLVTADPPPPDAEEQDVQVELNRECPKCGYRWHE